MNSINRFLNTTTMYRVVLYVLIGLLGAALALSSFNVLHFSPAALLFSTGILIAANWLFNKFSARLFGVRENGESTYITALILALIISPPHAGPFIAQLPFLILVSALAQASKYIFTVKNKHLFNPAALAVVLTAFTISQPASWWVGTLTMLPFTAIGGYLVVKKLRRFDVVLAFISTTLIATILTSWNGGVFTVFIQVLAYSPLFFFASIMLTEPLTLPPTKNTRIMLGILVGILFMPQIHFGPLYFSPELALLAGNFFAFLVSSKGRYALHLKRIVSSGKSTVDFIFQPDNAVTFRPGQYMEWTLGHADPDNRGIRRYFTIASSPTERQVMLGVKFYDRPSTFKKKLRSLKVGETIVAHQIAGDFTLPKDTKQKLAFIAGGIGITPFRSMIKYLLDTNEKRDIALFYANNTIDEIAYYDVFRAAYDTLGIRTVLSLSDRTKIPPEWNGYTGYITADMITREVPDFAERTFYVSGPPQMVEDMHKILRGLGISRSRIVTDFFPGLA